MKNLHFKVFYSEGDAGYITTCEELPGMSAYGDTVEESLREASVVAPLFIDAIENKAEVDGGKSCE